MEVEVVVIWALSLLVRGYRARAAAGCLTLELMTFSAREKKKISCVSNTPPPHHSLDFIYSFSVFSLHFSFSPVHTSLASRLIFLPLVKLCFLFSVLCVLWLLFFTDSPLLLLLTFIGFGICVLMWRRKLRENDTMHPFFFVKKVSKRHTKTDLLPQTMMQCHDTLICELMIKQMRHVYMCVCVMLMMMMVKTSSAPHLTHTFLAWSLSSI